MKSYNKSVLLFSVW